MVALVLVPTSCQNENNHSPYSWSGWWLYFTEEELEDGDMTYSRSQRRSRAELAFKPCSAYFQGTGSARESINNLVSDDEGRWTLWVLLTWGSQVSPFWPYPHSTLWQLLVWSWQCLLEGSRSPSTGQQSPCTERPWVAAPQFYSFIF